jgi:outer membrane protein TolC
MKIPWLCAMLLAHPAALALAQQAVDPAQSKDDQPSAQVLRLEDVVREALDKNPEAQSALHSIKALERRVPQAAAMPDPTVSVGWAGNPAPFSIMAGDASSYRGVTLSEQFPYPGKLKLQGAIAGKDVEAAKVAYEAIRRRIAAEVKAAFYDYSYFDKAIQATNSNKELIEKIAKIAEAQYRVGKAMQPDVLRSQVEISLLLEKRIVLEQQRATAQARINVFLLRSPESPLPPAEQVRPATIKPSLDELYALAAENDTAVMGDGKMIDRGRLGVALAQRQSRPDFGVSYMLQQRADQATMNGLTFSVNIPVFYKTKQRQAVAEATEGLLSAEKTRDNRLHELRFELKRQYLAAKAGEQLLSLYSTGVVPQSSLALQSSMAAYETGKADFLSLMSNFTTLLNYETDYYRQLADYQTAIARMESLTGTEITDPENPRHNSAAPAQETPRKEM